MPTPEKIEYSQDKLKFEDEKSKEQKEIELIEKMPLSAQDKKDLFLVYLGVKPAAILGLERYIRGSDKEKGARILKFFAGSLAEVKEAFSKLGFPYRIKESKLGEKDNTYYAVGFSIMVGRSSKELERLAKAVKESDHREIGSALGYPETAVEFVSTNSPFRNEAPIDYGELHGILPKYEREELLREGVFKFLDFMPSKNHWREELEVARKYQQLIKEKSPKIYEEILKIPIDPAGSEWKKLDE